MEVSVIISMCDNREDLFERSLFMYSKQTLSKDMFEIIIIDDKNRDNVKNLCKSFSQKKGLRFQYINVDPDKSFIKANSFTPALTNNIGFRNSRGEVVVIVGPETLVCDKNLERALKVKNKNYCLYGLVFLSDTKFVEKINSVLDFENVSFYDLLKLPGAKHNCHSCPPHPPAYWYWMVANKKDVFKISGVDERFMQGISGEDDDFANRMKLSGTFTLFDHSMIGIHQNHLSANKIGDHSVRFTPKWKELRETNLKFLRENIDNKTFVANSDHVWGDPGVIVSKEFF